MGIEFKKAKFNYVHIVSGSSKSWVENGHLIWAILSDDYIRIIKIE